MSPNTTAYYIRAYVKRRNKYCQDHISATRRPLHCEDCKAVQHSKPTITTYQVEQDEQLDYAAYLEYEICSFSMTLVEARYAFLERYPKSNTITGKYSVINLIIPYPDTPREYIPISPIRKENIYA